MTYNYTPIKSNKHITSKLDKFDQVIALGVKRICVNYGEFAKLHAAMSKDAQQVYKYQIPYKGAIIYCVDYSAPQE